MDSHDELHAAMCALHMMTSAITNELDILHDAQFTKPCQAINNAVQQAQRAREMLDNATRDIRAAQCREAARRTLGTLA